MHPHAALRPQTLSACCTAPHSNTTKFMLHRAAPQVNPICTGGGQICPHLSYFIIAPKLIKIFALMHPDFESNLITHIFRKFGVSGTTGSDVIFVFVGDTQGVLCSFEPNACLSVCSFYSLYCVFIINANL